MRRLDLVFALLATGMMAGLTLDIWAHHHVATLESFFTPWHAVLYSSYAAAAAFLIIARRSLSAGYGLALAGAATFAAGGLADGAWHQVFGVERGLEAAVSPSHLVLAAGGLLMLSAPLRAALMRSAAPTGTSWVPILVSLALSMTLVTQLTEYVNAYSRPWAAGVTPLADAERAQMLGLAGVLVQAAVVSAVALLPLIAGWRLPYLGMTLVFGMNALLGSFAHDAYQFIVVALAGGIGADVLRGALAPDRERSARVRIYAAAVPALTFAAYFVSLAALSGVWWSIALWSGAIVLAGATGVGTSFIAIPPRAAEIRGSFA